MMMLIAAIGQLEIEKIQISHFVKLLSRVFDGA